MNPRSILMLTAGGLLAVLLVRTGDAQKPSAPTKPKLAISIKPRNVADALRAVIQADREVYANALATHPIRTAGPFPASGQSQSEPPLPGPCEMLRRGSETVASKGVEYSYVLRALQPVNPRNAPETELESKGLQFVNTRPDLTYAAEELLGGRWYFTAVYPDVAIHQSCVTCHNQQHRTTGRTFKIGDVMGGLVVRIALEL